MKAAPDEDELRFPRRDQALYRAVRGLAQPTSIDAVARRMLGISPRVERASRIHHRDLPAPDALDTEAPLIDDPLMAAVVRARAAVPRWEAAWHFRGDLRVAPGNPQVFSNHRFVPASLSFAADSDEPVWRHYRRQIGRSPKQSVERAVLVRGTWERNYWHLLDEVLPRFAMASALGIDPSVPAIVSRVLLEQHGKRLAGTRFLTERKLIVQEPGQTVRCRELFLLRPAAFPSHWTPAVLDRIPQDTQTSVTAPRRRIYVRREPATSVGRTAESADELDGMFRNAGFLVVDPALLTIPQQRALFQDAEIIAGINGAAFSNAIFRSGRPLTIGAFISQNWMSTVFPTMAKVYGFRFIGRVVPTSGEGTDARVIVPPDTALQLIDALRGP